MSSEALFAALGFHWKREQIPPGRPTDPRTAIWEYRRSLAAHVWDLSSLEGNPITYPEVLTLLDGVTVGGHKIDDQQQVLRLAKASKLVGELAGSGPISITKPISDTFNHIIATDEALESGHFRGEGSATTNVSVHLGTLGTHSPAPTEPGAEYLRTAFTHGVHALNAFANNPVELSLAYFAFATSSQFYFDGNKRTARSMANTVLVSHGYSAVLVPASYRAQYNQAMIKFLATRDATETMTLLATCGPATPFPTPSMESPTFNDLEARPTDLEI